MKKLSFVGLTEFGKSMDVHIRLVGGEGATALPPHA